MQKSLWPQLNVLSTFDWLPEGLLIYPSQISRICEGLWAFGKGVCMWQFICAYSDHSSSFVFLFSLNQCHSRRDLQPKSHTALHLLILSQPQEPFRSDTMLYGHLRVRPLHLYTVNLHAFCNLFLSYCCQMPTSRNGSRKRSEFNEIKKNTENEILVVK